MKFKIKKVYYCNFCNKHGLMPNFIKDHEENCTLNPNRECGVCEKSISKDKKVFNNYIKRIEKHYNIMMSHKKGDGIGMTFVKEFENEIKKISEEIQCPACMLSLVRQSGKQLYCNYNYKEEMQKYWEEKRKEDEYAEYNSLIY